MSEPVFVSQTTIDNNVFPVTKAPENNKLVISDDITLGREIERLQSMNAIHKVPPEFLDRLARIETNLV